MNKLTVSAFTLFLTVGLYTPCVIAQDDSAADPEVTANAEQGATHITISWAEVNTDLAPLEVVELPEPQLSLGDRGERQTYLHTGEAAPWAGVLLNPSAIAFIVAEYQASFSRAGAALDRQRESDWTRLRLEVNQLRLQLASDRQQANIVIDGLNREIDRLDDIHENYIEEQTGGFWNTDFGQVLQWGLVILGSAAVGVIVGYLGGALQ